MGDAQQYRINISAPNLVNICIDKACNGEISGRLYHEYRKDEVRFANVMELIKEMEKMFDEISFPQASTKARCFIEKEKTRIDKPERVASADEIISQSGEIATFVTNVRFRQNSTWQGEVFCKEEKETIQFVNMLDFIKEIDKVISEQP